MGNISWMWACRSQMWWVSVDWDVLGWGGNEHKPLFIYEYLWRTIIHPIFIPPEYIFRDRRSMSVWFFNTLTFPMIHRLHVFAADDFFIPVTIWWLYWITIWPRTHTSCAIYIWWYCEIGKAQNDVFVNIAPHVVFRLLKYSSDFRPLTCLTSHRPYVHPTSIFMTRFHMSYASVLYFLPGWLIDHTSHLYRQSSPIFTVLTASEVAIFKSPSGRGRCDFFTQTVKNITAPAPELGTHNVLRINIKNTSEMFNSIIDK